MSAVVDRHQQRRAVEVFAECLQDQDKLRQQYERRPRAFLSERFHWQFPAEIRRLFDDIYSGRVDRAVAVAPTSGGKTQLAAGLGFSEFFFQDWCVLMVGGSLDQSKVCIGYVKDITQDAEMSEELPDEETKTLLTGSRGNWIKACTASTRAIRGQHAKNRAAEKNLLVILDEEAEMDEDVLKAAMSRGKDATRFVVLRISTNHKVAGTFATLVQKHKELGYRMYRWDSFDVCELCHDDCASCLVKHAAETSGDVQAAQAQQGEFHDRYCRGKAKGLGENGGQSLGGETGGQSLGVAQGPAKGQSPVSLAQRGSVPISDGGWLSLKTIRQDFLEFGRAQFEVDDMGWEPRGEGNVLPFTKVAEAYSSPTPPTVEAGIPKVCGIDWGLRGMTAVNVVQFVGRQMRHLASASFTGTLVTGIVAYLDEAIEEFGVGNEWEPIEVRRRALLVYADVSHPFNNQELRTRGFTVEEVAFNAFKDTGVNALSHLFELGAVEGCARFKDCVAQLQGWSRGKLGQIVKSNDHHPDSLVCAVKFYVDRMGGGVRGVQVDVRMIGARFWDWASGKLKG